MFAHGEILALTISRRNSIARVRACFAFQVGQAPIVSRRSRRLRE
jgi:hypothetical protein